MVEKKVQGYFMKKFFDNAMYVMPAAHQVYNKVHYQYFRSEELQWNFF